jgi:hypothetical protein
MIAEKSWKFYEDVRPWAHGKVVKLVVTRGTPDVIYNTKIYTIGGDEIWLSGFTCGKDHPAAIALVELIRKLDKEEWHFQNEWKMTDGSRKQALTRDDIVRMVLTNNKLVMEWKP